MKVLVNETTTQTNIVTGTSSLVIDCLHSSTPTTKNNYPATTISIQNFSDVNTPAAITFPFSAVNTTTDAITKTNHGLITGLKGQFTTDDTLPTGISASTDYFIIVLTANTFQVATSYAHAIAGTAVNITAQGAGNDTFTPTALAGGTLTYETSNDGTNWAAYGTANTITADGSNFFFGTLPSFAYLRWTYALTAGSLSSTNIIIITGEG